MVQQFQAFFNSPPGEIVRLGLLCALIFAFGRAALDLVLTAGKRSNGPPFLRNENYVAAGFGATGVLLVTWLLRALHLYSYETAIGAMLVFAVAAAIFNARYRAFVCNPWTGGGAIFVAYASGAAAFLIALDFNDYFQRYVTGIYIQQGWGLLSGLPPAFEPNFGAPLTDPVLYTGHLISAVFGLLGYGNHRLYHEFGTYWLNVLLAPAVLIGAYLFFRRFLSAVPAALTAATFCTITLGPKVWSLRGETIGWIVGFAFLIVLFDTLAARDRGGDSGIRGGFIAGLLFFGAILTHGISALLGLAAAAIILRYAAVNRERAALFWTARFTAVAGSIALVLVGVFSVSYAGTRLMENSARPAAGIADSAIELDNAWSGVPLAQDMLFVRAHPPYAPLLQVAEVSALTPVLTLFYREYDEFFLRDFPSLGIDRTRHLPAILLIALPLLPFVLALFYLTAPARGTRNGTQCLFWIALALYVATVAVAVAADARSVAVFPLAAVRRSYPYVEFFYWLAVVLGLYDLSARIGKRIFGSRMPAGQRIAWIEVATPVAFVFLWMLLSQSAFMGRASASRFAGYIQARLVHGDPANAATAIRPLYAALDYLDAHTRPGEWIYSNIVSSDNTFSYLSGGRYALLEGPSIYQLFYTVDAAAHRIRKLVEFAMHADPAALAPYRARYVLLYLQPRCRGEACYGAAVYPTNLQLFASSPSYRLVFRNGTYAIYRVTGVPPPRISRRIARAMPTCETNSGALPARIAACTTLIRLVGNLEPNAFYYRGIALLQQNRYREAIADFDQTIAINPYSAYAYDARALAYAARGENGLALSDLRIAEGMSRHVEWERAAIARMKAPALRPAPKKLKF